VPKTLVLVRHAKSAWPDDVADHDRPLAKRGRRDAPAVGRWLQEHAVLPQLALVSSARRAVETADLISAELEPAPRQIIADEAYGASPAELLELVRALPAESDVALLVGHNPGIESLAAKLTKRAGELGAFRTCAVAVFEFEGDWDSVEAGGGRLVTFAVPRG
jgi:phosphohistidine phosphatase